MRTEEWRPVEGFEGYLVSDFGRVKSLDRQCRHVARGTRRETVSVIRGRILKCCRDGQGYSHVRLAVGRGLHAVESPPARRDGLPGL